MLDSHAARLRQTRHAALFERDPARFDALSFRHGGLLLDLSKQTVDPPALAALIDLAEQSALRDGIAALFAGKHVNFTEGRAALHMVLRGSCPAPQGDIPTLERSFDQYGVELGKEMARQVAAGGSRQQDSSTAGLIAAAESMRKGRRA